MDICRRCTNTYDDKMMDLVVIEDADDNMLTRCDHYVCGEDGDDDKE